MDNFIYNINNFINNINNFINNINDSIDILKNSVVNNEFINAFYNENNIIIKFLKNIFLLIISILKTLSSNYVVLLIISVVIFLILTFLSERKLTLPCNSCENGSWYYKCKPGTGFGSKKCAQSEYVIDTGKDLLNLINNGSERYLKIVLTLLEHTARVIKKFIYFMLDAVNMLLGLLPPWLILKHLIKPVMNGLYKAMKAIYKLLDNFSCPFTIPIVNTKVDICNLIVMGIKFLLNLVVLIFKTLCDIVKLVGKTIYLFIKKYIIDQLLKLIGTAFKFITKNVLSVIVQCTQLLDEIKKPVEMIFDIPIHEYLLLLADTILNAIFSIFDAIPGFSVIRKIPNIILSIPLVILFVTFILPLIGGIIALFPLVKSIIYFIFGLDDDNDFKFMFDIFIKFINKIREQFK